MTLLIALAAVAYVASRVIFPREIAETAREKQEEAQTEAEKNPLASEPDKPEDSDGGTPV